PLEALVVHFFTTRAWMLGSRAQVTDASWTEIARAAGLKVDDVVRVRQVHGRSAYVRRSRDRTQTLGALAEADIVLTDDPHAAVSVQSADCVPILIADRQHHVAAAVHAGWRGMASRVLVAAIEALTREFGSMPEDLVAAVGPAIGPCCY